MDICKLTMHETAKLIKDKEIKVTEITRTYLDRIADADKKVGSYLTVCADEAMERASQVQEKIDLGEKVSPIAGIPIALKDNICTKGIKTSCASKMLHNFVPPYNATVVDKLRNADTILLGKLNFLFVFQVYLKF